MFVTHIHGQFFKVFARNGKPVDEPYFRDTVLLQRKETIDAGMVPVDWGCGRCIATSCSMPKPE